MDCKVTMSNKYIYNNKVFTYVFSDCNIFKTGGLLENYSF